MEAETWLSFKTFLRENLLASSIELPTDFYDSKGKDTIQEWDGALLSGDTLYLLEAKHFMTVKLIQEIESRVKNFPEIVKQSTQKEFMIKYNKIVGVALALYFQRKSKSLTFTPSRTLAGLKIVYSSGDRYLVE